MQRLWVRVEILLHDISRLAKSDTRGRADRHPRVNVEDAGDVAEALTVRLAFDVLFQLLACIELCAGTTCTDK